MTDSDLVKVILFGFFSFGIAFSILAGLFMGYRRNRKEIKARQIENRIKKGEEFQLGEYPKKPVGPPNRILRM